MEYAAKFTKLSQFARHQVPTKEMKMDRFEQGLKGSIKSMVRGTHLRTFGICINEL